MMTILSKTGMVDRLASTARLPSQIGDENQRVSMSSVGSIARPVGWGQSALSALRKP